jgi:predicted O-methyltransferase YrrM
MKSVIKYFIYRSSLLRYVAGTLWNAFHPSRRYHLEHLAFYREEDVAGPLQRDEALFLFALTKVLRPAVIVEFGFHCGHSAFNFLEAVAPASHFYSYDIDDRAEDIARGRFQRFQNFHFLRKSQADFCPADIGNRQIDLCFLDASHLLELNQVTFRKLEGSLSERAIIVVHDTGTWVKEYFNPIHAKLAADVPGNWISEVEFQPCKGEREFVNWVLANCPGFSEIHLHSKRTLRNGMTLIQKNGPLPTEPGSLGAAKP